MIAVVHFIMLPTNREIGDFAIRMTEAIHTLAEVERRNEREVFSTLSARVELPSEIFEAEIATEKGVEWNAAEKARWEPLMVVLDENCVDASREKFLACLAEITETLSCGTALTGVDTSKASAVWRSCREVLFVAGWPVKENASKTEFWTATCAGRAETWFDENCVEGQDVLEERANNGVARN